MILIKIWITIASFFQSLEIQLQKNHLLATIKTLSPEWSITLNVRLYSAIPYGDGIGWCSIILITKGSDNSEYGYRTPLVELKKTEKTLHFASAINGTSSVAYDVVDSPLQINQNYHIQIDQRYVSAGNYQYSVRLDGVVVFETLNTDARQFYDMKVYAGNPWRDACPVMIRNLHLTNFV
uniref:Uncharacterized protein n=1 Tax=Clytia hemisphaerica TaxID=252671 RepID=A0A7M5VAD7_9CNID